MSIVSGLRIVVTPAAIRYRWLLVACQAATIAITWPLWQTHDSPPMLPMFDLPAVNLGVALLVALATVLIRPVHGLALFTGLAIYAMAIDQTRMQPEVVSLTILLWGTLPFATTLAIARAHLIAMWFFAGFNKLMSPDFMHGTAQWMLSAYFDSPPSWLYEHAGYVIGITELSVAMLAIVPATRLLAGLAAFGLHLGILIDLSPIGHDWNESVWPWNIALAVAGFAFIAPWAEASWTTLRAQRPLVQPVIALLLVSPLGFYAGVTDAYLSHNLYTSNTARARVECPLICEANQQPGSTWKAFNVPMPPEHRLFKQYFERTCSAGDRLVIEDTRWWFRRRGDGHQEIACT